MRKLLALNRGEIAIRIFRAANELGIRTVAVYSQEDRLSLHRFKADEAYLIGEGKGPVQAYLDVEGIVPGGQKRAWTLSILATDSFRRIPACRWRATGRVLRLSAQARSFLELLGDKTAARKLAQSAGIPVVPGTEEPVDPDSGKAREIAARIGFPLIVKAAFGGGGRGMRVVKSAADFEAKLQEARQEAGAAFGNDAVFLERYIRRAKHIEMQILGDTHGNVLHLYERDCSVQRRHQKVVEVAPAVALPAKIRAALADAAVALARAAQLLQRRHCGVSGGRRDAGVVLHRSKSARTGGAYGHRNGDRH